MTNLVLLSTSSRTHTHIRETMSNRSRGSFVAGLIAKFGRKSSLSKSSTTSNLVPTAKKSAKDAKKIQLLKFLWSFFFSHTQLNGGDQCMGLSADLLLRFSLKTWYDQRAAEITAGAMQEGVRLSAVFLLLLTDGVLKRPYCRQEINEALVNGRPILLLLETDAERGGVSLEEH